MLHCSSMRKLWEYTCDAGLHRYGELLSEALGFGSVKLARKRLSKIAYGEHWFPVYSAKRPFPFFPESVFLKKEKLVRSTQNAKRLGSVYNNWSIVTVFDERERKLRSVAQLLRTCSVSEEDFRALASAFWHERNRERPVIGGAPEHFLTWHQIEIDAEDNSTAYRKVRDVRLRGLLRAASTRASYLVLKDEGIFALRSLTVASMTDIKDSLDKLFIAVAMSRKVDRGLAVPALFRAVLMWSWLAAMVILVTFGAQKSWLGLERWTVDYFEALVFACISVPALVEFLTEEPSVIRNALRANRVLWKNSQVMEFFKLNKFDYAVMALTNDPVWLVSDDKASFTQQGGHPGLLGDVNVTDTDSLRKVGFYVGRSVARREWESVNLQISNRADGSVRILPQEGRGAWIAGDGPNRPVS